MVFKENHKKELPNPIVPNVAETKPTVLVTGAQWTVRPGRVNGSAIPIFSRALAIPISSLQGTLLLWSWEDKAPKKGGILTNANSRYNEQYVRYEERDTSR